VGGYTLGDVSRICGVSTRRLRYWQRTQLLGVQADAGAAFGFSDLVSVRRLAALLDEGVPLRRIRRSLAALRERMPEIARPLEALRPAPGRARELVARHHGMLVGTDGQLVLDLDADEGSDARVTAFGSRTRGADHPAVVHARDVAESWFERGCMLDTDRATYADAIAAYEQAVAVDPDFADAWCNLGTVFYNQERRGRARECFERSLELEPHHLEGHLNMAALIEEAGRPEAALVHYKRALAADPLCVDTHVSLALVFERIGLPGRGREHWRRYLQLDPDGGWADVARSHLERSTVSE
jgi:tetratricopeptide (TPR) repeat protein